MSQFPHGASQKHDQQSPAQHRADAGEPALRRQNASGQAVPVAGGAREKAASDAWRRAGVGRAEKDRNAFKHERANSGNKFRR